MPETLTLTNGQLANLAVGLAGLDGLRVKADEFRPYKYDDAAETAWLIASNAAVASDALRAFDRAKKMLAVQHGVADSMPINAETAPKIVAFTEALAALEDRSSEIHGLTKIKRDSLNAAKNGIPPSILAKLMPILE